MTGYGEDDDCGDGTRRTVVLTSPEELIAAVPAMLGFPPAPGSVVVMCGEAADGSRGPVVRIDAPALLGAAPDDDEWYRPGDDDPPRDRVMPDAGPARGVAEFCAREGIRTVHLVVVHEGCADRDDAGRRAGDAADAFAYWLGLRGTEVAGAYGVGEFAPGASWVDLFGMACGTQADPDASEIAAINAFDGRARARSREEIERIYRERDADACDDDPHGPGRVRCGAVGGRGGALARHDAAAERMRADEELPDEELAAIGVALRDVALRDAVYSGLARKGLDDDDGRRRLWWAVARRRPARERSVALLLLGAAAYFSGSGVHARSALEAALEADPRNSLARLLVQSLDHGIAPERLRSVAAA